MKPYSGLRHAQYTPSPENHVNQSDRRTHSPVASDSVLVGLLGTREFFHQLFLGEGTSLQDMFGIRGFEFSQGFNNCFDRLDGISSNHMGCSDVVNEK